MRSVWSWHRAVVANHGAEDGRVASSNVAVA
eukprot:COSAG06_NODE_10947_length_1592_cov_1.755526_3_plen_30_part_01